MWMKAICVLTLALAPSCRLGPEDNPMIALSRRCDAAGVEGLIDDGWDPNDDDEFGDLPIVSAVVGESAPPGGEECAETIWVLFDSGASLETSYRGESMFFLAAVFSDGSAVVGALANAGVDPCVAPGEEWSTSYASRDLVTLAEETNRPLSVVDALKDLPSC